MSTRTSRVACAACGWMPGPLAVDPYPFRCPRAGLDEGDHVVRFAPSGLGLSAAAVGDSEPPGADSRWPPTASGGGQSSNPFVRYRRSLYSWSVALAHAVSDADYVSIVEDVDAAVARVGGCGFRATPFGRSADLSAALGFEDAGGVLVKDETNNVSGSHKARHLMGVALYLEVVERVRERQKVTPAAVRAAPLSDGLGGASGRLRDAESSAAAAWSAEREDSAPSAKRRDSARLAEEPAPLAIASCGNAALAAAVVARAIGRQLLVFVPGHASPRVVAQLEQLGARVTRCVRPDTRTLESSDLGIVGPDTRGSTGSPHPEPAGGRMPGPSNPRTSPGDPCYLAFRRAIAEGALPFSCQGSENGLAIEGGATLAYEMCDDLAGEGLTSLDRVFIQVGGGALASACVQGFDESILRGRLAWMPRIHAVQTRGGYPLKRAYDLVVDRLLAGLEATAPGTPARFATDDDRARHLQRTAPAPLVEEVFAYARRHRREFMWPWESEPRSVAGGILDDETYDWAVVVEAMVKSGGFPIVVDEATLDEANVLARRSTAVNVDHTGSAGLAGLLALSRSPAGPRPSERVAVLFTGVRRE